MEGAVVSGVVFPDLSRAGAGSACGLHDAARMSRWDMPGLRHSLLLGLQPERLRHQAGCFCFIRQVAAGVQREQRQRSPFWHGSVRSKTFGCSASIAVAGCCCRTLPTGGGWGPMAATTSPPSHACSASFCKVRAGCRLTRKCCGMAHASPVVLIFTGLSADPPHCCPNRTCHTSAVLLACLAWPAIACSTHTQQTVASPSACWLSACISCTLHSPPCAALPCPALPCCSRRLPRICQGKQRVLRSAAPEC